MEEQKENNNQYIKALIDFFNATADSEGMHIDDVYIREAIVYCMNKSVQKGERFDDAKRQMTRIKLNINKAFKAVAEFDENKFEMEFIPLSKVNDRISDLRVENIIERVETKSKDERIDDLKKQFYGEDLAELHDDLETSDISLHMKTMYEKPISSENDTYLTVQEVALRLKISEQGVRKHIKIGNLKAERFGKFYRIKTSDFNRFQERKQ